MNRPKERISPALALIAFAILLTPMSAAENETQSTRPSSSIVLGGGCFWCVEALFETLDGVTGAVSGYAGGKDANPDYYSVCSGKTGHAEVVRIDFDSDKIYALRQCSRGKSLCEFTF